MAEPIVLVAGALVAGAALGVHHPVLAGCEVEVLIFSWLAAVGALLREAPRVLLAAAMVAFLVGGQALARRDEARALEPPIRAALDRLAVPAQGAPVVLEGTLVEDASPTDFGATLRLHVTRGQFEDHVLPAGDGVRLSVGGALVAAHVADWRKGRRVRVTAILRRVPRYLNPGVSDQETALAHSGIALVGSVKSGVLVEVTGPASPWQELASALRAWLRHRVRSAVGRWSERSGAIVMAVLIGDRAGLTRDVTERLQRAGTFHVIAISGGNIAILSVVLLGLSRALGCPPAAGALGTIGCLLLYYAIAGTGPSVARATLVAIVYLGARAIDHRGSPLNTVAVAAVALLLVRPLDVTDLGFVLSFGATLAILVGSGLLAPQLASILRTGNRSAVARCTRASAALLAATLCAEVALMPVMAAGFSRVTFAGLLLNFAAIPLMTAAEVAGFVAIGASLLSADLGAVAGYVAHLAASGLVESARLVDVAPWSSLRVPAPGAIIIAVYYAALGLCVFPPRGLLRLQHAGALLTAVATLWILIAPVTRPLADGLMRVTFLDVDQGDATVVQLPGGRHVLVDAGGPIAGRFELGQRILAPALWQLGIRHLDSLVLTHGDPDHIGGALAVLADFRPREIWEGVPVPRHEPLRALRQATVRSGWRTVQKGDRLAIGGAELAVWHPSPPDWERQEVRNDDSVVLELRFGDVSIVLAGDIGEAAERTLLSGISPAPIRVVKVPHHGSRSSSSPAFVTALAPAVAVVSAGRANRYGHPARDVLARYRAAGAAIFRTDEDGAVMVETDGRRIRVRTMTGRDLRLDRRTVRSATPPA